MNDETIFHRAPDAGLIFDRAPAPDLSPEPAPGFAREPVPAPMPDPAASPAHLRRALELYESLLDARALAEAMDGSFAAAPIFRLKIGRQIGLDALGLSEMAVGLRLRALILADIESWKAAAGELLRVQFKIPIAVIAEMEREHARRGRDWSMTGDLYKTPECAA